MKLLRRLRCLVFGHTPDDGVDKRWSVYFFCSRCRAVKPGGLAQGKVPR